MLDTPMRNPKTPKIEKDIPMPMTARAGAFAEWPIKEMKVGDSILLPEGVKAEIVRKAVKRMAPKAAFSFLKTSDGIRCWRTK